MFYSEGQATFQWANQTEIPPGTLVIVIQEVGQCGILIQQYGVPLTRMVNGILTLDQQWLLYRSDFPQIFMTLVPGLTFIELRVVFIEHLQRVWLASRERLHLRTPGFVPVLVTCLCSNCWDQVYRTYSMFFRLFIWNFPRYFFDLAVNVLTTRNVEF